MGKYKTIEEIRLGTGLNQKDFAQLIGCTFRSYQGRLYGEQPRWRLDEIIKAAEQNEGYIKVKMFGEYYDISIQKK